MTTMNNEDPADTSVHEPRELPEPVAWRVYFPVEQCEEFASSLDDLLDDLTNCAHDDPEPLYTADQMREAVAAEREWHAQAMRDALGVALNKAMAIGEMLAAVVQGAKEEFVRVPYGASHEDVAAINDWHKMAAEALAAWENKT